MDERANPASFIRHLWGSFLLYTAATGLLIWWMQEMPWGMDEIGAGRGLVVMIAGGLWIVGLLLTLAFRSSARRSGISRNSAVFWGGLFWVLSIAFLGLVLMDIVPHASGVGFGHNERNASASLKTLATAEADFRANDRDANKTEDYWVGDVAGLYCIVPASGGEAIKLIELSVALADASPLGKSGFAWIKPITEYGLPQPKAGYRYRVLTHYVDATGKRVPYHTGSGRNPDRFGFCAYPDSKAAGRRMFIINEEHHTFWKRLDGEPADTYPQDPLKEGWERLN